MVGARTGAARRRRCPEDAEIRERSEEHTSELQSRQYLVCRLLLEKKIIERNEYVRGRSTAPCTLITFFFTSLRQLHIVVVRLHVVLVVNPAANLLAHDPDRVATDA